MILTKFFHGPEVCLANCFVSVRFQSNCLFFPLLILKSGTRSCGFYRFKLLWNWPCIYVCQENTMSHPCPLTVHQKHLKDKNSREWGWVIRLVVWLSPFDWNSTKKTGFFWVPGEIKDLSNNRRKPSEQDHFVDEQTRMKWKYGWHV